MEKQFEIVICQILWCSALIIFLSEYIYSFFSESDDLIYPFLGMIISISTLRLNYLRKKEQEQEQEMAMLQIL